VTIVTEVSALAVGTTVSSSAEVSGNQKDPNLTNNSDTVQTVLVSLAPPSSGSEQLEGFLTTALEMDASEALVLGHLQVNGQELMTMTQPGQYGVRFVGSAGTNVVEAHITMPPGELGRWRFDFSRTHNFEAASIDVSMGQALSQDAHSVVFRLGGGPQLKLKFSFRLKP
jgi:hypothetical protein